MSTEKQNKKNLEDLPHEVLQSEKIGKNKTIILVACIVAAVLIAIFASCTTSHRVSQSASTFKSGDTLTTTIIYQQTGNLKRR